MADVAGTFMSMDKAYRDYFVRNLHDALSGHSSTTVDEAVQFSEHSNSKCIGITIETRPDYCLKPHISSMLAYGCTRLEIGVQSVYEDIARDTNRGHTVRAVVESFQLAKDSGYKVAPHTPHTPHPPHTPHTHSKPHTHSNPLAHTHSPSPSPPQRRPPVLMYLRSHPRSSLSSLLHSFSLAQRWR